MKMSFERCTAQEACIFFGGSEKLLSELRDRLQDWLKLQPHLPQDFSEKKLEWLILQTKFSLERAKQKLDMYYTMRNLVPELYRDRDLRKYTSRAKVGQYVVLPNLTPDKHRVMLGRLTTSDLSLYDPWEITKYVLDKGGVYSIFWNYGSTSHNWYIFMSFDVLMNEGDHAYGFHIVFDLSMISLSHLLKLTPADMKKWEITFSKAYALHLKGIHLINARPYLNSLVTMVKSVTSKKISERVHAHPAGNLESLYRFIPRSALPSDYGGDQPTMDELTAAWTAKVEEWRDWFLEQENVLANERLRPGPALDKDSLFGFSGSFRKLDVD